MGTTYQNFFLPYYSSANSHFVALYILSSVREAAAKSRRAWPSMGMFRNSVTSKVSDAQAGSGTSAAFKLTAMFLCLP